jgi:1,4-dihydroxy-2-naphthoate octaprenyltransferase
VKDTLKNVTDRYTHAVLALVSADGYPISVATAFRADPERGVIVLDRPAGDWFALRDGTYVNVLLSHIRPQPGIGYDERRYVSLWGPIRDANGELEISAERFEHWDERQMPFFEYCERGVPRAQRYMAELSRQSGREVRPWLSKGWLFLRATRLPFLTATVVSVLLGLAIAAGDAPFRWGLAAATLIAACAVHLGLNVANDVFDTLSGADAANVTPTPFSGGSRVIVYGLLSLRQMIAICAACYAVGLGIGLCLAIERGFWPIVGIGAAGAFVSLAYTAPPFRLVHHGLGEIAVALGFGPIMTLGAYTVEAQRFSWEAVYASLPVGILIALVLYVNEIPDRRGDERAGKRTLPVRLSPETVVAGYGAAIVLAFALIVVGAASGVMARASIIALAAAPMAFSVYRGLQRFYDDPYALMPAMARNIQLHLATGMLLVSAYLIHLAFRL